MTTRNRTAELKTVKMKSTPLGPEWEQVEGTRAAELTDKQRGDYADPSEYNLLYHAFDGRVVPVPTHMASVFVNERFPYEDWVPVDYRGKYVWHADDSEVVNPERTSLTCPLSDAADDATKEDLRKMGYVPGTCTKRGISNMREHIRRKHRAFDKDWTQYQSEKRADIQMRALLKLAGNQED